MDREREASALARRSGGDGKETRRLCDITYVRIPRLVATTESDVSLQDKQLPD
jgi:hypothetical protein